MKKDLIDQRHVRRMEDLLQEPKIAEAVLMDIENLETYQVSDVNGDGTITLGKRKVRWWNRLFGLERTISFKDFAFNTLRALVGMAENLNKNTILQGLPGFHRDAVHAVIDLYRRRLPVIRRKDPFSDSAIKQKTNQKNN